MIALRTYRDTKIELNIAKNRLYVLKNIKEELQTKYAINVTSTITDTPKSKTKAHTDKMADYMHEITKINDNTGLSLDDEIKEHTKLVASLTKQVKSIEKNIKQLEGTCYMLYTAIVIDGMGITKGVEYIAEKLNKSNTTVWKYYYPKIEQEIKKLSKYVDI